MFTFYKNLLRPLLFSLSPDVSHRLASFGLKWAGNLAPVKSLTAQLFTYHHSILMTRVNGIEFSNPIGLSAGFDPSGNQVPVYDALGFGFVTIGSVTLQPQSGNPRPHSVRLKKDESLIVNKGLMNKGASYVADLIKSLRCASKINYPLGISIARTTDIADEGTARDYAASFHLLAPYADYIEINVSCPNVTCFSPEKQVEYIHDILKRVNQFRRDDPSCHTPLWLKLGSELSNEWDEKIIQISLAQNVSAIVLVNAIKDRSKLKITSHGHQEHPGGISGKLLAPFAEEKLKFFHSRLRGKIPLISSGGIFTAKDAYRRIRLGASLVQILTGWIYEGPSTPKNISRGLAELLQKDGFKSLREAVGADLKNI